jgi:hypothetical protein
MCLTIDDSVTSLNKGTVWKVFDRQDGPIVSLFKQVVYPKGKLIERSTGAAREGNTGHHGLHFFLSKRLAKREASTWHNSYIAKFKVNPTDFMFINPKKTEAMYERATRVGNYIKVEYEP